jgi:hypothetical protein
MDCHLNSYPFRHKRHKRQKWSDMSFLSLGLSPLKARFSATSLVQRRRCRTLFHAAECGAVLNEALIAYLVFTISGLESCGR